MAYSLHNDVMNIERFHNELAMRLGYERIVKDKRIQISVEESDDPVVTLKIEDGEDIRFAVTENPEGMDTQTTSEIKGIVVAAHQAYMTAVNSKF